MRLLSRFRVTLCLVVAGCAPACATEVEELAINSNLQIAKNFYESENAMAAFEYMRSLRGSGQLPGVGRDESATGGLPFRENEPFITTGWLPGFLMFYLTPSGDDSPTYTYVVSKQDEAGPWQLTSAWRTLSSGRREVLFLNQPFEFVRVAGAEETSGIGSPTPIDDFDHPDVTDAKAFLKRTMDNGELPGVEPGEFGAGGNIDVLSYFADYKERKTFPYLNANWWRSDDDTLHQYLIARNASGTGWEIVSALRIDAGGLVTDLLDETRPQPQSDAIVALVNSRAIRQWEIALYCAISEIGLADGFHQHRSSNKMDLSDLRGHAIENLVERELIVSHLESLKRVDLRGYPQSTNLWVALLKKHQFKGDEERFEQFTDRLGISLNQLRRYGRKFLMYRDFKWTIAEKVPPATEEELRKFYESHIDRFNAPPTIRLRSVAIPKTTDAPNSEALQLGIANLVREELLKGVDVAKLEEVYQIETFQSGDQLPWLHRGLLRNDLGEIAFALPEGGVSEVIDFGERHILLRVEGKRPAGVAPFEDIRDQVAAEYKKVQSEKAFREWVRAIRAKSEIERKDRS